MASTEEKHDIRKAMYNLDEEFKEENPMKKKDQEEVNYAVKELKRQKDELGKLIGGLRIKRGGIMEEMDSAHFDFKKIVKVKLVKPCKEGLKFSLGFWVGTALLTLILKLLLNVFGTNFANIIKLLLA